MVMSHEDTDFSKLVNLCPVKTFSLRKCYETFPGDVVILYILLTLHVLYIIF